MAFSEALNGWVKLNEKPQSASGVITVLGYCERGSHFTSPWQVSQLELLDLSSIQAPSEVERMAQVGVEMYFDLAIQMHSQDCNEIPNLNVSVDLGGRKFFKRNYNSIR